MRTPRSISMETLMLMAKYDDGFRDLLRADRRRALDESGIGFTAAERMVLESVGPEQFEKNIDGFELTGVTRKSLPNWRAAASVMVLVSSILFGFNACTHQVASEDKAMEQRCQYGCWIDGDAYRLYSAGASSKKLIVKDERKIYSKKQAVIMAQYRIVERFKGALIESATGIMSTDSGGVDISKEIKEIILKGTIISERYDEEDNCEILYEVKEKGLKRKLEMADWLRE